MFLHKKILFNYFIYLLEEKIIFKLIIGPGLISGDS